MDAQGEKLRLAVLVSGGGTNLQAMIDRSAEGTLQAEVAVVMSDRADAYGLVRAEKAGIPTRVVDYGAFGHLRSGPLPEDLRHEVEWIDRKQRIVGHPDAEARILRLAPRVAAERELLQVLEPYRPDYVCLAGFMRLLTPFFLGYCNRDGRFRVINIHPALLPAFPGEHGYEDTFQYGCRWGGVTVHFVDEGEDTGPIIAQAAYPIWPEDRLEDIRSRGLQLEYEVYAQCINWLARDQVEVLPGAGERRRVHITDPLYRTVVLGWARRALT